MYAAVPPQQQYGEWDAQAYADAEYGQQQPYVQDQHQGYGGEQYQAGPYQAGQYGDGRQDYGGEQYRADPYQADPYRTGQYQEGQYQEGQYDPYGYGQQQPPQPYAEGNEPEQRPDGSNNR